MIKNSRYMTLAFVERLSAYDPKVFNQDEMIARCESKEGGIMNDEL